MRSAFGSYLFADASLLARGLYPAYVNLQAWTTIARVRPWAGTTYEEWTRVSTHLGAADVDQPLLVAAPPPHLLVQAASAWDVADVPGATGKVRVGLTWSTLRLKFHMDQVDVLPPLVATPAPAAAAPAAGQIVVQMATPAPRGQDQPLPDHGSGRG